MTKRYVDYEWTLEELDADGDIIEVHFGDTLAEMMHLRNNLPDARVRIGVCRHVVETECAGPDWRDDPTTNEVSRDYGYFDANGLLPAECDFGAPLPGWIRRQKLVDL